MKWTRLALVTLASCGLLAQQLTAQETAQPVSIQEVTYNYVIDDEGDSPSDKSAAQKSEKKADKKSAAQKSKKDGKKSAAQKSKKNGKKSAAQKGKKNGKKSADQKGAKKAASKSDCGCDDGKGKGGALSRFCKEHKAAWSLVDNSAKGKAGGIAITGHTQFGYHTQGMNGHVVPPQQDANGVPHSFNDYPNRVQLHQQWLTAEKVAHGGGDLSWGFRMDWLYGTDGPDAQSFNNNAGEWDNGWTNGIAYGNAIPQLYAEVAVGDLRVRGGHFLSPLGYESVNSTENFFYSRSYGRGIVDFIPRTVTGVQVDYAVGDNLTAHGGWVNGYDTGFGSTDDSMFLGGATVALANGMDINYMLLSSDDQYAHSIAVANQLTDRIHTVFESVLRTDTDSAGDSSSAITLNNYVFYDLNDCMKVGLRSEWVDMGRSSEEFNAVTVGINYQASANLLLRPEARIDNFHQDINDGDNDGGISASGRRDSTVFGFDAIWSY
mgnify:CR=1 FL=1